MYDRHLGSMGCGAQNLMDAAVWILTIARW